MNKERELFWETIQELTDANKDMKYSAPVKQGESLKKVSILENIPISYSNKILATVLKAEKLT